MSKQLTHVQRLALLYITGAMRTTPTAAMQLLVGLVPLPTFIQQEVLIAYYRLRAASQSSRAAVLIEQMGTPKTGSGPINAVLAAFFVRRNCLRYCPVLGVENTQQLDKKWRN